MQQLNASIGMLRKALCGWKGVNVLCGGSLSLSLSS